MKAFLAGLGIGIGVGILFAPDSGEVNRKKLGSRLTDWSEKFKPIVNEISDRLQDQARASITKSDDQVARKKDPARADDSGPADSVNTITREELMNVNGIGPVLADKIISGRPYSSPRELVDRSILPQSTFEELERELKERRRRFA